MSGNAKLKLCMWAGLGWTGCVDGSLDREGNEEETIPDSQVESGRALRKSRAG